MPVNYNAAFEYLMRWEVDPIEPGKVTTDDGGRTRYGIAEKFWGAMLPPDFYTTMSPVHARMFASGFYDTRFWEPMHLSSMRHQFVADYILSIAVNCGIEQVVKWLQMGLNVPIDGILGPETLAAILGAPAQALSGLYTQAMAFYSAEPAVYRLGLEKRARG